MNIRAQDAAARSTAALAGAAFGKSNQGKGHKTMTTTTKGLNSKMNEALAQAILLGLDTAEGSAKADQYIAYRQQLTTREREARYAKRVAKQSTK